MRKILVLLLALCLVSSAYAVMVDTRVSPNTVSFNTIDFTSNRGPRIVTFNSVTNHIRLVNLSRSTDCYADIRCVDANGISGYATDRTCGILLPAIGDATPNTVEFDFATKNIAFMALGSSYINDNGNNLKINYVVTGDGGDL